MPWASGNGSSPTRIFPVVVCKIACILSMPRYIVTVQDQLINKILIIDNVKGVWQPRLDYVFLRSTTCRWFQAASNQRCIGRRCR